MKPGDQIGDYVIKRYLDEGGMSEVYLAEDKKSGRQVVVKQLKGEFTFNAQLVERFGLGARIMTGLRHPHLAYALDYIERDGKYLVVEEYLPGGDLADVIKEGSFSEEQAMGWCRDALRAVDYAHQNGIVHRDLKPSNLMLDEKGEIKVTDFGIAKVFGGPRLTRTGTEIGTPAYMSPEQILNPQNVDHLTDVYSMGVVLYELLTGVMPFDGDTEFEIKEKVV